MEPWLNILILTLATSTFGLQISEETAIVNKENEIIDTNNADIRVKSNVTTKNKVLDEDAVLLLTPFIEQGRTAEARNKSSVDRTLFFGLESYSGFLTVNSTYKSHLFFWYFPCPDLPVNETPWIIWLQGGPGSSSLNGLFEEIGPFKVSSSGDLYRNPHTWLMNHSLVFIDNPVGTGFSFTEHKDGYAKDMDTYSKHLYTAVRQLVQIFPELRVAPLFVAGESYAGKYVPALASQIHRHKHLPGMDINLKGLIIGNGFIEPEMVTQFDRAFYQFGLVEKYQIDVLRPLIDALQADVDNKKAEEAYGKYEMLMNWLTEFSHKGQIYNYLRDDPIFTRFNEIFLNKREVKLALHVGDLVFSTQNNVVRKHLIPADFLSNTRPMIEALLEHYKVLIHCGSLDMLVPCGVMSERMRAWQWGATQQFLQATRRPYTYNGTLAGYTTSGGGLTWAITLGSGHMTPVEAPATVQALVTQWIAKDFASDNPLTPVTRGDLKLIPQYRIPSVQNVLQNYRHRNSSQ